MGKTTVLGRLAATLAAAGVAPRGFLAHELRESSRRVGFEIETFDGERAVLAHVHLPGPPRVGRYGVDIGAFEAVALPSLAAVRDGDVVLIDELGKMELASEAFRATVSAVFAARASIVATVLLGRHPFTDELKRRPNVELVRVSARNRDELPELLARRLRQRSR